MPLVRVEVRNEYGLGAPELYKDADKEDSKALLEGLAVTGLVGILRQLGDLAEFAAEVFHGLQEQVTIMSSRSHKLIGRVKRIEAALPPLEKKVLAQRSHLHLAYTTGLNWRANLPDEKSHFIYSDLPRFMMDSYDQCQGPPNLNLLDKFDPGGPGSCLKRYSDPSFFKKALKGSAVAHKKSRKIKHASIAQKKRSWLHTGEVSHGVSNYSGSLGFASLDVGEKTSPCPTVSTYDVKNSELGDHSFSFDSRNGSIDFEHVSNPRSPMQHRERDSVGSGSSQFGMQNNDSHDFVSTENKDAVPDYDSPSIISGEGAASKSNQVSWDEKMEMLVAVTRERDSVGSGSSQFGMQNNDSHDFASTENKDAVPDYDSPSIISGEGAASKSNQVGWDEKMEMLVAVTKEYDGDALDALSTSLSLENNERGVYHLRDESKETFSSNLDLEVDERTDDFHTSAVHHQGGSLEILPTTVNGEKLRGSVQFETASPMVIQLENEKWLMQVPDDAHHNDLDCETVVKMNNHRDEENILLSNAGDFHHDEIESETDHFVDALNAIESEYESDADCQTNQEVKQHSLVDNEENGNEEDRLKTQSSGILSSNCESIFHTSGSSNVDTSEVHPGLVLPEFCSAVNASPDKILSIDLSNSVPFESHVSFQPELADEACNSSSSSDVDSFRNDNTGSSNVESAASNVPFLGQNTTFVAGIDKNTDCSTVLPNPPPEPSTASSTKLWTNGGLLGLQPSKPPDFSVADVAIQASAKNKEENSTSLIPNSNVTPKSTTSIEDDALTECSTSDQDDRKGGILTRKAQWRSMSADLGVNLLKLSDSYLQRYSGNFQKDAFSQSGAIQPVCPDVESSRASQEKSNSSRMGNRLALNGIYQKPAVLKNENSRPVSSINDNGFEQSSARNVGYQTFSSKGREMLESKSQLTSPASSPPLGHMKISFQPMNGSKTSILQLKFPDGNISHEGGRDLFAEFQLVPDPSVQFHNVGFDSDDDTFCRSPVYASDHLGHQSDSNSEQWESSESPSDKDKDLYDALRRISLTESVSTSCETGEAVQGDINNRYSSHSLFPRDKVEYSYSSRIYDDLPSLDTIHPSFKEVRNDCVAEQEYRKEFTASPQPLPQSERQAMKLQLELPESRPAFMPENVAHIVDGKLGSMGTQQPKPAPLNQEEIDETPHMLKSKPQDLRKLPPEKNVNQAPNGNTEQKGDFLQQIRAKSLNLRRTSMPKPVATADTTSVQMNAILEKANAIRQVVGSDWEDDAWSDT